MSSGQRGNRLNAGPGVPLERPQGCILRVANSSGEGTPASASGSSPSDVLVEGPTGRACDAHPTSIKDAYGQAQRLVRSQ